MAYRLTESASGRGNLTDLQLYQDCGGGWYTESHKIQQSPTREDNGDFRENGENVAGRTWKRMKQRVDETRTTCEDGEAEIEILKFAFAIEPLEDRVCGEIGVCLISAAV